MTSSMGGYKGMKEKIPGGYKAASLQQFTPEQMQLFQQMFLNLQSLANSRLKEVFFFLR